MDYTYAQFSAEKARELLAIDSPTGFTHNAAGWVRAEFENLGYEAQITTKGGVLIDLGGEHSDDGLLLEALETAPGWRRMGYAVRLIQAVQQMLEQQGSVRIYSHVSKKNTASLKTHLRCGFEIYLDHAAYIDGSVNRRAYTLRYEKNFSDFEKKN